MANYVANLKTFRCLDLSRIYNLQNNFQYKKMLKKKQAYRNRAQIGGCQREGW